MIALVLVQAALAAQVDLEVDTSDIREGQTVDLTLTVRDTTARGIPEIAVPSGLQLVQRGQSQRREIINFQSTLATTYDYALTALTPGDYVIAPVAVVTNAGTLRTAPLSIHVAPRGAGDTDSLLGEVGTKVAWVGEVLVYHLRFQTEKKIVNGRWTPPNAPGFTAEPSVEPVTAEYQLQQEGKPLAVQELFYPLRASAPGTWTIPGGVLQAQFAVTQSRRRGSDPFDGPFGMFGNTRTEVYSASPLDIEVKPLPKAGRPPKATELVGHFQVHAEASDATVKVGDTVTVVVTVDGDGALAGFALPALDGQDFRVYDDQPVVEARIEDGKYHATATFKRAIVPQSPGDIDIPPIDVAYFDPTAGAWTHAATDPVHLHVGGEAAPAVVNSFSNGSPTGVDALGEDILPVRTDARLSPPLPTGLASLLLVPGSVLLGLQGLLALRRRPARVAQRRLDFADLPADPDERLAGLERIFRERVAARLGIASAGLRGEDLAGLGSDAPDAEALYRDLERLRYGGVHGPLPEDRVRALVERL